jgi:hypothetical protein
MPHKLKRLLPFDVCRMASLKQTRATHNFQYHEAFERETIWRLVQHLKCI